MYAGGFLFFHRQDTLLAQPFDPVEIRLTGEAFPIIQSVSTNSFSTAATYSVSGNRALIYRSAASNLARFAWFNRDGKRLGQLGEPADIRQSALSPNGERVVFERVAPPATTRDLWLIELDSGIFSRLTFDPGHDGDPVWSPDSKAVAFSSQRKGSTDIYRKVIGASGEELIFSSSRPKFPEEWLPDGSLFFINQNGVQFSRWLPSAPSKPELLVQSDFQQDQPAVSPDGKWVAFSTNESGRWEVYTAVFPSFTQKRQISNSGGGNPTWRRDGRELFYLAQDARLMSVVVKSGPTPAFAPPQPLFQTPLRFDQRFDVYSVTRDGQKFLLAEPVSTESPPIQVILNWTPGLAQR
jgi:Tol biopolymer transport system component